MIKYDAGTKDLKNWLVQEMAFDARYLGKCEAIFAQGNGYLGVRNALEEAYTTEVRNMFVTGTFNKASEEEVTELPNVPDMTGMSICVEGHAFDLLEGHVKDYTRTLNLKTGETVREVTWVSPTGVEVTATFRRMVSLEQEHVFALCVDLSCDREAKLVIETGVDGAVTNSGAQHFENLERRVYDGVAMQYLSKTTQSDVWIAQHAACVLNREADVLPVMGRRTLKNRYTLTLPAKETLHMEKLCTVYSTRDMAYEGMTPEDAKQAAKDDGMKALHNAIEQGYDTLLEKSAGVWARYWEESDVQIEGDADFDQLAVRFALYHLNIMVKHDDDRVGIGAKALTGEGYKGHSFWDTEMFILPYFTFTRPETARTLLQYRYRNLYGAHLKAKECGYEGAMYPWECAWVDDGEVTPLYMGADIVTGKITKVWTGLIEHHISADIAYAVQQYADVTGDTDYMERCGYEIILDTALFWASRVQWNEERGRYEILDVIGPDEYKEHVDNNAYTNYMAHHNMRMALDVMAQLEAQGGETYERLNKKLDFAALRAKINACIEKIYLPVPNENGIVPQFDGYLSLTPLDLTKYKSGDAVLGIYNDYNTEQLNHYMVSKQADTVMLFFLLDELFDFETKKKNFVFYEDKTLHDSSLSKCTHAILACDYGMEDMAYNLYRRALTIDLGPYMKSSNEGIHSASTGGIWESTVMGFGGVRIKKGGLTIAPRLPKVWKTLSFPLVYQGAALRVRADHHVVCVENHGEHTVELTLCGERVTAAPGRCVEKRTEGQAQ